MSIKTYSRYVLPLLLTMMGGALFIVGLFQDRSMWTLIGAGLALFAGLAAFALQAKLITRRSGTVIGIVLLLAAIALAWRNYASGGNEQGEWSVPDTVQQPFVA